MLKTLKAIFTSRWSKFSNSRNEFVDETMTAIKLLTNIELEVNVFMERARNLKGVEIDENLKTYLPEVSEIRLSALEMVMDRRHNMGQITIYNHILSQASRLEDTLRCLLREYK